MDLNLLAHCLETRRLALRRFELCDAPALLELIETNRQHLERWLRWPVPLTTRAAVEAWLQRLQGPAKNLPLGMAVTLSATGELIGAAGLRLDREQPDSMLELSYFLSESALGHGYVSEAVECLTRHALEDLAAEDVQIRVDPLNERSVAVCLRCGYSLRSTLAADASGREQAVYGFR
ncbi:MAG: GNAT family N-acetyltransferase [Myxococcales bacterium]|nr:GNAT family N-acetyltransferase [Myxococcales bacterium]